MRFVMMLITCFLLLLAGYALFQRKLLYYPTHHRDTNGLSEWRQLGEVIGYAREVPAPRNVWLMMHGNAGQASDRVYALASFSRQDSVYILEYPGYGSRPGSPSMASFNKAAEEGYRTLRARFPHTPVCAVGESVGSGPASALAGESPPPDRIVLITPFDLLSRVANYHFPYLPARLVLRDNWNNVQALKGYRGPVEIFGARDDTIIPVRFARALAENVAAATFHEIPGGHNEWAVAGRVEIRNP